MARTSCYRYAAALAWVMTEPTAAASAPDHFFGERPPVSAGLLGLHAWKPSVRSYRESATYRQFAEPTPTAKGRGGMKPQTKPAWRIQPRAREFAGVVLQGGRIGLAIAYRVRGSRSMKACSQSRFGPAVDSGLPTDTHDV